MASRVAIIGIIVESMEEVESMNNLLHQYADYIISRTGVPYLYLFIYRSSRIDNGVLPVLLFDTALNGCERNHICSFTLLSPCGKGHY